MSDETRTTPDHHASSGAGYGTGGSASSTAEGTSRRSGFRDAEPREDAFGLVVSILLFGYFGFFHALSTTASPGGPVVPLFAFFVWTLRISAVGFLIALLLQFARQGRLAVLVAGVVGLLSAVAFLAAGVWDMVDDSLALAMDPIFLLLFAAWNGYVSWGSLSSLARRG